MIIISGILDRGIDRAKTEFAIFGIHTISIKGQQRGDVKDELRLLMVLAILWVELITVQLLS
jgi:hypothetical protein